MANRESEADRRAVATPSGSLTPTSGAVFIPICHKFFVNVTGTGTLSFHTLDGTTSSLGTLPVGVYVFDVQADTLTWTGTMVIIGLYHV